MLGPSCSDNVIESLGDQGIHHPSLLGSHAYAKAGIVVTHVSTTDNVLSAIVLPSSHVILLYTKLGGVRSTFIVEIERNVVYVNHASSA
jgi:hypothetical protein